MSEKLKQLVAKIVEFWNKYTTKQKTLIISIVAAVIVTLVALFFVLNRVTYVTLTTFDNTAAAAEADALLTENGITHRVSDDALTIEVAEEQISDARLLLGQNGISTTVNNTDYDWFFDNSFNTTDSEKKLKAKINLQSEMEQTLSSIEGVTKASVTIDMPDSSSSIYSNEEQPSVSIMLTTNANFNKENIEGIVQYARTSVGADSTDDITVIDNQGNLLHSELSSSTNASVNAINIKQQTEEYYNSKLWNLMVNSGAYDEVSVSSNLAVSISDKTVQDIKYYTNTDDDTGPKETYYYYLAENVDGTGGVVGTDANGEEITDYDLLDDALAEAMVNLVKEEYATSSTTTTTTSPVGEINLAESSMSVYLTKYQIYDEATLKADGTLDDMTFKEFKAANSEVQEIINSEAQVSMLANATGIKESKIYVVERIVPVFYDEVKEKVSTQSIISIALAVLIGLLLLFVVFKSMKPDEVVETEPELSVEALLATTKENQSLEDIEFSDNSASKELIEKFVDEKPEAVAALLRNWLNEWE